MNLYIDGDALPNLLKPILLRAIERLKLTTFIVSNRLISIGQSKYITSLTVASGADEADHRIVEMVEKGDLVITADIPLAAAAIEKEGHALNPRGEFYTPDNIKERLAVRDMMDELRGAGVETGGPAVFSASDKQAFANKLDAFLARQ